MKLHHTKVSLHKNLQIYGIKFCADQSQHDDKADQAEQRDQQSHSKVAIGTVDRIGRGGSQGDKASNGSEYPSHRLMDGDKRGERVRDITRGANGEDYLPAHSAQQKYI